MVQNRHRTYQPELRQRVQLDLVVFVLHRQLVVDLWQLQVAQAQAHLQDGHQESESDWLKKIHHTSFITLYIYIYVMTAQSDLVEFGSDGREIVWHVFLDLLWLSSQRLPEAWRLLVLHEGGDLRLPFTLVLVDLFCK